jgi:tRNA(fMet)-specific endonuclease VapC
VSIAAITASELLHGVERVPDETRKAKRKRHVEQTLERLAVIPFDLPQARVHAQIWAELVKRGLLVGAHDLLIAAAGVARGDAVGTLNVSEFSRVPRLKVLDARPFLLK